MVYTKYMAADIHWVTLTCDCVRIKNSTEHQVTKTCRADALEYIVSYSVLQTKLLNHGKF
jgi:hypothetical protein